MAKKTEQATKEKLHRLERAMGTQEATSETEINSNLKPSSPKVFKTTEVVGLIIITVLVSLTLGGLFTYKIFNNRGELVEKELQDFIKNYQYILDNYNGDINKEELLDAALEGMLTKLDKNSTFLDSNAAKNFNISLEGSYQGIGIEIYNNEEGNIVINKVFKDSPADKAGLKAGDIIVKADGKDTKKMKTSELVTLIGKNKTNKINLSYIRDGKEYNTKVSSSNVNLQSVISKTYTYNSKKIGYIRISIFASNTYEQFKNKLEALEEENIDSLIIDLRDNSGGYLSTAENIISLFLDSSHPIYQIQKQGVTTKYYSKGKKNKNLKIAILVNNSSASASEILTSALMEQDGAIVIGEKTYGKGTVQELQDLTNGDKYKLTTKNWLTSKGKWIDKKGIEPTMKVELSPEYAKNQTEANDNQLQTALKELTK